MATWGTTLMRRRRASGLAPPPPPAPKVERPTEAGTSWFDSPFTLPFRQAAADRWNELTPEQRALLAEETRLQQIDIDAANASARQRAIATGAALAIAAPWAAAALGGAEAAGAAGAAGTGSAGTGAAGTGAATGASGAATVMAGATVAQLGYGIHAAEQAEDRMEAEAARQRQMIAELRGEEQEAIPLADESAMRRRRRNSIASLTRRRGRQSTILTGGGQGALGA